MSATLRSTRFLSRGVGQWIGWTIVAALLVLGSRWQGDAPARENLERESPGQENLGREKSGRESPALENKGGLVERLLGPIAMLAASLEWVRADAALRAGDYPLAYARAETALEIEPSRADGWIFLAHHLIFERASLAREIDPAERKRWVQAGLDLLDRGLRASRDPDEILVYRGGVFVALALIPDADRPWPGSARDAWLRAADSFDRAAIAGQAEAAQSAAWARTNASTLAPDPAPPFREVPKSR